MQCGIYEFGWTLFLFGFIFSQVVLYGHNDISAYAVASLESTPIQRSIPGCTYAPPTKIDRASPFMRISTLHQKGSHQYINRMDVYTGDRVSIKVCCYDRNQRCESQQRTLVSNNAVSTYLWLLLTAVMPQYLANSENKQSIPTLHNGKEYINGSIRAQWSSPFVLIPSLFSFAFAAPNDTSSPFFTFVFLYTTFLRLPVSGYGLVSNSSTFNDTIP